MHHESACAQVAFSN